MASDYFKRWTTPERLALITGWCREGHTKKMLAERIGISICTLRDWCKKSPELNEAIMQGKEIADYMVENALFKAALGFEHTETKTYISGQPDKAGNRQVRVEKTVKYFPPNVTAMAIWLNNRKPDQWKRNRDNAFELNSEESSITVNIVKHSDAKKEKEEQERREREGIKEETVDEEEYEEYQKGYVDYKEDEEEEWDEFEEQGKGIGVDEEVGDDEWAEEGDDEGWDE